MNLIDFLTDLAGIAGLCLSIFLAVSDFLRNRLNFEFSVLDYRDIKAFGVTQFFVSISNKSKTPLVITEFVYHGTTCELEPKKIRGEPNSWNGVTTPRFPLCIPSYSAQFVYLEFVGCEDMSLAADTWMTLQIQTISRLESRTVLLPSTSHYLHNTQ